MARSARAALPLALLALLLAAPLAPAQPADCPPAPEVSHVTLSAACASGPVARSAIGCSIYRLCADASVSPPLYSALCATWRVASSLCSDDAAVVAAVGICPGCGAPALLEERLAVFEALLPKLAINLEQMRPADWARVVADPDLAAKVVMIKVAFPGLNVEGLLVRHPRTLLWSRQQLQTNLEQGLFGAKASAVDRGMHGAEAVHPEAVSVQAAAQAAAAVQAIRFDRGVTAGAGTADGTNVIGTWLSVRPHALSGSAADAAAPPHTGAELASDSTFSPGSTVASGAALASAASLYHASVLVSGLQPGQTYFFRFQLAGPAAPGSHLESPVGSFTLPAAGTGPGC
ncbi:hypothetical protein TSOC_001285 [Tetrabaena socialis]|uniref:Phospholipase D N-terminal domain-containing protein n=1 Tax=Tetrabaena socialis TaxID=47790 RepID=A0A2J8AHA0_9CHLO|nr:hypothetical protein TSOC_001285 [Tetrabaena socialis]|eukprot:PNH11876.1 hypothetical protein TSOC_001285 [Tetrabaena socialis]